MIKYMHNLVCLSFTKAQTKKKIIITETWHSGAINIVEREREKEIEQSREQER